MSRRPRRDRTISSVRNGFPSTGRASRPIFSFHRRLRVEPLEDRRPLAITVNTLVDETDGSIADGDISLRDAIAAATSGETIDFSVIGTINLTSLGHLVIGRNLTIDGPGADFLSIRAFDETPDVKNGDGSRVFNIDDGNDTNALGVSISGLTLTGGDVGNSGNGGAIRNLESLTVAACTISGNATAGTVTDNYRLAGGGIYSAGNLTISASTISDNFAQDRGGGILMRRGKLLMTDCTVSGNTGNAFGGGIVKSGYTSDDATILRCTISDNVSSGSFPGGGIFHSGGTLTIEGSTLSRNSATRGGGVYLTSGKLIVTDSTVNDNTASHVFASGGGIYIDGGSIFTPASTATIANSTISGNASVGSGGGILSFGSALAVTGSTISGNSALRGAGIYTSTDGTTTVLHCTISGNLARDDGAGIFKNFVGSLSVSHSTITLNEANSMGGGVFVADGSATLDHTIVAENFAHPGRDLSGLFGAVVTARFSLIGSNANSPLVPAPVGSPDANGNIIGSGEFPIDPLLGPLADNGGPTKTHALLVGSPAIDAGDPNAMAGSVDVPEIDQRGAPWSRVADGRIDIGAVESQPNPLAGDYNFNGSVDAADYVIWRKTLGASVASGSGADGDGDAMVDEDDHGVWRTNFGRELPAAATISGGTAAAADESQETSAFSTAGQASSGTPMQPLAHADPVPSAIRDSVEPSLNPSLRGRGTVRALELRVAERRDGALESFLALRGRKEAMETEDGTGTLCLVRYGELSESQFHVAFDEAFALRGFGRFLSPFQGSVVCDGM
jgi:hypothetical protein